MVRIAISQAAFEAIARTLPFGGVAFENKIDENGDRLIWLELRVVDRVQGPAWPGRELQRRNLAAGVGKAGARHRAF